MRHITGVLPSIPRAASFVQRERGGTCGASCGETCGKLLNQLDLVRQQDFQRQS